MMLGRSNMSAPLILIVLCCVTVGGCAAFSANDAPAPRAVPPPPEGKKLAELVSAAFKTANLPGAPEVSPVRAAHDTQWGDWVFCIKSNKDESPKYAVLINNNTISEVRSFVSIDGCDKETYRPVEITDQHGDLDQSHSDPIRQSQRRH